jgi:S1-C subfamily serine protease
MNASRRGQLTFGLILATVVAFAPRRVAAAAADHGPTTAPATRPSPQSDLVDRARRLIAQLAANDYDTRAAARVELMGFRRADLGAIREGVRQNLPLVPNQVIVLREIVTHVYLSGDLYVIDPSAAGFMGVSMPDPMFHPEEQNLLDVGRGVPVLDRVPGFPAYRLLQNGDVMIAMSIGGERVEFNEPREIRQAVGSIPAGHTITFEVLRYGRLLKVPITLSPKPLAIKNALSLDEFNGRRTDQSDEVWERDFAPLLGEHLI